MEENKLIRKEVLHSVSNLSDEQLNQRVEEGRWTIAQVLVHLYLMERVITKSISEQLVNEVSVAVEDKPIHLSTNRSTKVKAPEFLNPSDGFYALDEIKEKLSHSRQAFIEVVSEADPSLLEQRAIPHPVFGQLSLKQWIPFVGLHEKRHLEQIEELKAKLL